MGDHTESTSVRRNWLTSTSDSIKNFFDEKKPPKHKIDRSIYDQVRSLHFTAKIQEQPQKKLIKGELLLGAAQLFSLPSTILAKVLGAPYGLLTGMKSQENKSRLENIKDHMDEGAQVISRLAVILPTTWIAMGLAYLGEKYITATPPFIQDEALAEHTTFEKVFKLAHLILNNDRTRLMLNNPEVRLAPYSPPKKEIQTNTQNTTTDAKEVLLKHIESLKFTPSPQTRAYANELVKDFIEHAKEEFRIACNQPDLSEEQQKLIMKEINNFQLMLREAENGDTKLLMEKLAIYTTDIISPDKLDELLKKTAIQDIDQPLSLKTTEITAQWQKNTMRLFRDSPVSNEILDRNFYQNSPKSITITSAPPNKFISNEPFHNNNKAVLNAVFTNEAGIDYEQITQWQSEPRNSKLDAYPSLALAVASNITPYKEQSVPVVTVVRDLQTQRKAPLQNVMVIEIPHDPTSLSDEDAAKLAWQIASAEFNAFEALVKDEEIETSDRHLLKPLDTDKTPKQHFLHAAFFILEASLRNAPISIPSEPKEYLQAYTLINDQVLPFLNSLTTQDEPLTRKDIIDGIVQNIPQ